MNTQEWITKKLKAMAAGAVVDCPAPIPGYKVAMTFHDSEGNCWCVYVNETDPSDWYMRPCL